MSEGVRIEVDQDDLNRVLSKLKNLEKAPNHLKNAINRAATQTLRTIKKGRSQGYTLKAGRFNKDIQPIQRANAAHLDATIKAKGRPPTLIGNFKTSMPKAGGKADVLKTGLKKLITSVGAAFVPSAGKAAGRMVSRKDNKYYPEKNGVHPLKNIHVLHGNSVPKMIEQIWHGKRGGQGALEEETRRTLHNEMMREIEKIMEANRK